MRMASMNENVSMNLNDEYELAGSRCLAKGSKLDYGVNVF